MSRRYGRNQKRKAQALLQAEIDAKRAFQFQLQNAKDEVVRTKASVDDIFSSWECLIEVITKTLGHRSLLYAAATGRIERIPVTGSPGRPYRLAPEPDFSREPFNGTAFDAMLSIEPKLIYELICEFKEDFKGQLVATLTYSDKSSCLAMSRESWMVMPRPLLINKVAADLVDYIRKNGRN